MYKRAQQFHITISGNISLSVISGFGQPDQPEVGLIVKGRCVDVCPLGNGLADLFNIVERVRATDYCDFPYYHAEMQEVGLVTEQVYAMGGGAD